MAIVVLQRLMPAKPGWPVLGTMVCPKIISDPGGNTAVVQTRYFTLEDPYIMGRKEGEYGWLQSPTQAHWPITPIKLPGVTAIPAGTYRLQLVLSTRFGRTMPFLMDVPGFTGILLHEGNTQEDTQGCIIVGRASPSARMVTQTSEAIQEITAWLGTQKEPTWLEIRNPERSIA